MPSPWDFGTFDIQEMRRQAFNNALAEMGRSLVQAGMPSPRPVGIGSALGMGIGGFNTGMEAGQDQAVKRYLLSMEIAKKRRDEAAAAQREKSLAILRGGPPAVVSESPGGERTAQYDPNDPSFRGAMFDVAPEQAVAALMREPPKSLAQIAAEGAASNAWRPEPYHAPPSMSATERLIAARNALLIKQARGETLTDEEALNLNSWNDALVKGYVVPEGGELRRQSPGVGTVLPTNSGATQVGPASSIPAQQPGAVPPQLRPIVEQRLKPLPRDVQDDLTSALGMSRALDQIAAGIRMSGRISGNIEKMKIWAGIGSQEGMDFDTAQKNFRVSAQALIKGIPSNFDVQTFINTLPDLSQPEQTNTARYSFAEQTLKELVATKVGYYKGLQYQIPDEITALAVKLGVSDAPAVTRDQATARLNALQKELTAFRSGGAKDTGEISLEDAAKLDLSDPKNRQRLDELLRARGF